jgi:hypothetical protein
MPENKQAQVRTAQTQIASLEQNKKQLAQRLAAAPAAQKRSIQTILDDVNKRIAGAKEALQKLISAVDMVQQLPGGKAAVDKAKAAIGSAIDNFLEKYGNKSFEIVRSPKFSLSFPTPIALVQISGGANIVLSGSLKSERNGTTITSQANLTGSLNGNLSVNIGAKIAGVGVGLEGGINVSGNATGTSTLTLSASGTDLSVSMNPADINISASASLSLSVTPSNFVVNKGLSLLVPRIPGASLSGSTITYPLGTAELLIIKTPIYSLTFSMTQAKFALNRAGAYSCRIHPKLVARFNALKRAVGL